MMKRYILMIAVIVCCACDNVLNVTPRNSVTFTNFFKTEEDLNSVVVQMHSFLNYKIFENESMLHRGILCDKIDGFFGLQRMLNQKAIVNAVYYLNSWKNHYDIIYVANVLLDNVHRAEQIKPERLNFYLGQAYFIKGFVYFDVARKWGEAVITKSSTEMGAYAKSSMTEVIDEAIRNAEKAYKLLPLYADMTDLAGSSIQTKQYGCKGSAAALLAHLYAWKGSIIGLCRLEGNAADCYRKSVEWSSLLIEKKAGDYALVETTEEVCTRVMSGLQYNEEAIFDFQLDQSEEYVGLYLPIKLFVTWPVDRTALPGSVTDKELAILSETVKNLYAPEDLRREAYFYKLDSMSHDTMNMVNQGYAYVYKWREGKYKNIDGSPTPVWAYLNSNYCYWRLADIYLLRAECYAKLGDERGVDDLNVIRKRAGVAAYPAPDDTQGLQYAVFCEREKELIFEGHRYYDIVRNGLDYIREKLEGNFKTLTLQDIQEGALFLPVSEEAFHLNDRMRQNVYWSKFIN